MKLMMLTLAFVVLLTGAAPARADVFLDLSGVSVPHAARLLRGLDLAAKAGEAGGSSRDALRAYIEGNPEQLGQILLSRIHALWAADTDGSAVRRLVAERDGIVLQQRSSPLYQKLVVPAELADEAPLAEVVFWREERAAKVRRRLARAAGLDESAVVPGPELGAALRGALVGALCQGFGGKAGRLRRAMEEATHALRALRGRARLAAAAGSVGESAEWSLAREVEGLDERILGALVYLDDTQIRDRLGRLSAVMDSSEEGDGATSKFVIDSPFMVPDTELPLFLDLSVRNDAGQWASFIHFAPKFWEKVTLSGRAKAGLVQDSNLFTTAFVAHPLFMVEDPTGVVDGMLADAMDFIGSCRRGPAYAFWPRLPADVTEHDIIGPVNTPYGPVALLGRFLVNPHVMGWLRSRPEKQRHMSLDTLEQFMDPQVNPAGTTAVVNIPADADDTAVAVASQVHWARRRGVGDEGVDQAALEAMSRFRDLERSKEDPHDAWKGRDSGGFLTWIRDEDEPTLSDPSLGAIPMEVNNLDSVVQANALYGLTMAGRQDLPGYAQCRAIVARVAREHLWPQAAMYYPGLMIFPYCASRAYRDAGARDGDMRVAMGRLLVDVLALQHDKGSFRLLAPRNLDGAFRGDPDRTFDVPTALACTTLMNLGEDLATEMGVLDRYRDALARGMSFLLREAKPYKVRDRSTFAYASDRPTGYLWAEGLFFSSGPGAMGYWRSEPYTVAMVLEALVKYRLGYDRHSATMALSPRVRLVPGMPGVAQGWRVDVAPPVR